MAVDNALSRVFTQVMSGNVGMAIAELNTYLAAWANPQTQERLNVIKEDYQRLVDYWMQGTDDDQRPKHYQRLLQQLYVLTSNILLFQRRTNVSYLHTLYVSAREKNARWSLDEIRSHLEGFVTEVALLELTPQHLRQEKSVAIHQQHQQLLDRLFNFVVTSNMWSDSVAAKMEELLVTPTIDSVDQQLLTSAIMLSHTCCFDMAKLRLLMNVYLRTSDEYVRQRALVGWVFGLDANQQRTYPEQRHLLGRLLRSEQVVNELTELQMQIIYTVNAERDTATMQQEIIPELMKNQDLEMTAKGLVEREEDELENVLHPEAAEERMERLEQTFRRMQHMQQQGSDLFFSGFSQMKRYPFFYSMSNWLMPFYMEHPDIQQFLQHVEGRTFLERVVEHVPFCNSDKYSFVIAFQQVMSQLPPSMRDAVKHGDAVFGGGEVDDDTLQSAAYIRRNYLMDLYRFYKLFPNRQALYNPFYMQNDELDDCLFMASPLLNGTPVEQRKHDILRLLRRQKMPKSMARLADTLPPTMRDATYYILKGDYQQALALEPDNEQALAGAARQWFKADNYAEACDCYEHLLRLQPDKTAYMLGKAVCQSRMGDYEEALHILFQLNYQHPDDMAALRTLSWTLLAAGRIEQAVHYFTELTAKDEASSEDFKNQGYALWITGEASKAVQSFQRSLELAGGDSDNFWLDERELLHKNGISDMDVHIMDALVKTMTT